VERHRITGDAAFGYLSRASQEVNMKLTAVDTRPVFRLPSRFPVDGVLDDAPYE
jgi:hypothetical protein